jgi:hypothetical protein
VKAINDRYRLLAIWYTHSVYALRHGRSPVVPLWYEWPEIDSFHDCDHQILLADALLVAPVLDGGVKEMKVSIPPGVWYDFSSGAVIAKEFTMKVTMDDVPVFIREGRIVPIYDHPRESTTATIQTPLTLIVAIDKDEQAEGFFYMDDGSSFRYENGEYIHRKFIYDNKVLRAVKVNESEGRAPSILKGAIISNLVFYRRKSDGSPDIVEVNDLQLKLKDEWIWSDWPSGVAERRMEQGKDSMLVVSMVGAGIGICVVGVVVGVVMFKMLCKPSSPADHPHYT